MIRSEDEKDHPTKSIKELDLRKVKINKAPIEQQPDHKLKNKVMFLSLILIAIQF